MRTARLSHLSYELPGRPVSDAELASRLGCETAKVEALSRGRLRHLAPDGTGPTAMAAVASGRVLEKAGLKAADLDLIVFATNTPDIFFPGSACLLQAELDAAPVASLDLRSQCTGFIVALDVARRFIATGRMSRILIAAAEVPSHQHRMDGQGDVSLSCLTTDGAAVGLLEAGGQGAEVLSCMSASDGGRYQDYWCEFPASRHFEGGGVRRGKRITKEHIKEGRHFPIADFAAMRATAEAELPGLLDRALDEASLKTVDVVLVAHLDPATEDALALSLGSECGRVIHSDLLYGVGASLPLALARETEAGRIGAGESVALLTAGSGASWGAAVLRTS